jgi:hypothetical protein
MAEYEISSLSALGRIPADDAESAQALVSSLRYWLDAAEMAKWPRAMQIFENASYLIGNHLTRFYYTQASGFGIHQFGVTDSSQYDVLVAKTSDNKLIRPVETVSSMLTQNRPMGRAEPNSDLPEDEDAAALSSIVLDLLWERPLNMPAKTREAALLGCIAGTVACEVEFGPTQLPIEVPKFKTEKRRDEYLEEDVEVEVQDGFEAVFRNDIQARLWTFFHLTPDPAATCPDDMQWIARTSYEDIEWIREMFDFDSPGYFPEALDNIASPDSPSQSVLYWWVRMQDIIESPQYFQHGGGMSPHQMLTEAGFAPGQTKFTVVDVRPTTAFPRGRTLIMAGGQLIFAGDSRCFIDDGAGQWKYPWRWHPYAFWGWFRLPGRFWHVPLLSQLLPLQKKINAIDALVHANRQFMAIGQWLLPKHSKVAEGMISGIPGQHITYTHVPGMSDPKPVDHRPLPAELLAERQQLEQSIDYIAASGVMDGANISASAARAGSMLGFLREEKLRSKSPMIQEFEAFLETISQNVLIEVQHGLTDEDPELSTRVRAAAREHSELAIQTFTGTSLRDHHSIKIDVASELLKSAEADANKALEFTQFVGGQLTPLEREGVQKAIGLNKFVKNPEASSVSMARRLISRIVGGQITADRVQGDMLYTMLMPGVAKASAMLPVFQRELLSDRFHSHSEEVKALLLDLFKACEVLNQQEMAQAFQMQLAMVQAQAAATGQAQQPQQKQAAA